MFNLVLSTIKQIAFSLLNQSNPQLLYSHQKDEVIFSTFSFLHSCMLVFSNTLKNKKWVWFSLITYVVFMLFKENWVLGFMFRALGFCCNDDGTQFMGVVCTVYIRWVLWDYFDCVRNFMEKWDCSMTFFSMLYVIVLV